MKKIFFVAAVAALMTCGHAQAQQKTSDDDMMKAWMAYMTPGDMHKMLAADDGAWTQEITMWMTPDAPPEKSTAKAMNKMILGGRYQESTTTGSFNGMPFEGRSIVGFDNAKQVIVFTWVDNMGTGILYMEGTPDKGGKSLTLKGKMTDPMTGKDLDVREVMTFVDNDTRKMEMYMTHEGKEFKSMEITMKRAK